MKRLRLGVLATVWVCFTNVVPGPARAAPPDRSPAFARALYYYAGLQGRILWVDATANLDRITTREGIADIVARARDARFTTIVVDVKPVSGHVVYPSAVAPRLTEWRGKRYPDVDVIQAFLEEGRRAGLEIAVSVNTFSEGHKHFGVGLAYSKPEWQSTVLCVRRTLRVPNGDELRVRAADDPDEDAVPTVQGPDYVLEGSWKPGTALAIALDHEGRVSGMIDPGLLGDEPVVAPRDGRLLVVDNAARDWASTNLSAGVRSRFQAEGKLLPITEAPSERVAAFVNPLHPQARAHELAVIREILTRYPVDAIVLDRMRYASIYADFSPLTRNAFERWLGRSMSRWPQDVLDANPVPGEPVRRGPFFRQWLEFRARVMADFIRDVRQIVRSVRPEAQLAAYVGSWFTEYYGVGVNWGSERYPVGLPWATSSYSDAGYAEQLDWLTTGCYYPIPTRERARALGRSEGATVETAAVLSTRVTANAVPVYAGLYALNYEARPQDFIIAMETATRRSAGVMLFDCSHIDDYGWWPVISAAFQRSTRSPHACPGLLAQIRSAHDAVVSVEATDGLVGSLPAVPYQPGGG